MDDEFLDDVFDQKVLNVISEELRARSVDLRDSVVVSETAFPFGDAQQVCAAALALGMRIPGGDTWEITDGNLPHALGWNWDVPEDAIYGEAGYADAVSRSLSTFLGSDWDPNWYLSFVWR